MSTTEAAVTRLKTGESNGEPITLTVTKVEKTAAGRFRLTLSDGKDTIGAGLAQSISDYAETNIKKGGMVELTDYMCNSINGKHVVIVKSLTAVTPKENDVKEENAAMDTEAAVKMECDGDAEEKDNTENTGTMNNNGDSDNNITSPAGKPVKVEVHTPAPPSATKSVTSLPRSSGKTPGSVQPIKALNPYNSRWTIKARVTSKGEIKRWSNARGEGQLFAVNLLDDQGTEIRATFFQKAVDKFYDALKEEGVYTFSRGRLKVANTAYTSIKNNYEITFGEDTVIMECDDDTAIAKCHYNFIPLDKLPETKANTTVDVLGVIHTDAGCTELTTKDGRSLQKRDLVLVDSTSRSVRVTLWGNKASRSDEDFRNHPVIALKGCKLSEYGGRSIGTYSSTNMVFNPDIEKAVALRQWYSSHGGTTGFLSISSGGGTGAENGFAKRKSLMDIEDEGLGKGEKPDYITTKASVTMLLSERGPWYPACPDEGNNKKLVEKTDGTWFCEGNQTAYDKPQYRYILPLSISDASGTRWITAFNDHAEQLLGGKTADAMHALKEQDMEKYTQQMNTPLFKEFVLRLRIKEDSYADKTRTRVTVMRCQPINYAQECKDLVKAINTFA